MARDLTAAEILERARWVYANCRTYQDRGEVVERIASADDVHVDTTRKPFSTAFVRPDRFRFEWAEAEVGPEDEWDRALILWNADGVRSSWTLVAGVEAHDSVHAPIVAMTGVSSGSAYTVPTLLVPGGTGRDPLATEGVALRGLVRVDEHECYELRKTRERGTTTLCIDCATFLLRRVVQTHEFDRAAMEETLKGSGVELERDFPTYRSESTTTYEPLIDSPIEPERFEEPPSWPGSPRPRSARAEVTVMPIENGGPDVVELLARVRTVYSRCSSIRDHGTLTTVFVPDHGKSRTERSSFSIDFVRPDRFRFEKTEPSFGPEREWMRSLALWNGEGARERWGEGPELHAHAADPAMVLSHWGLGFVVPGLVVAGPVNRDPLPVVNGARLLGTSAHAGRDCFLVQGMLANEIERRIWIDRERFLVLRCDDVMVHDDARRERTRARIEENLRRLPPSADRKPLEFARQRFSKPSKPFRTESTLLFEPELNAAISEERFATPEAWRGLPIIDGSPS